MDGLKELRTQCLGYLLNSTNYCLKYLDGEEKSQKIKEMKTFVESYCLLDNLFDLEEAKTVLNGEESISSLNELHARIVQWGENMNFINHPYMKLFEDELNKQVNDEASQTDASFTEENLIGIQTPMETDDVVPSSQIEEF